MRDRTVVVMVVAVEATNVAAVECAEVRTALRWVPFVVDVVVAVITKASLDRAAMTSMCQFVGNTNKTTSATSNVRSVPQITTTAITMVMARTKDIAAACTEAVVVATMEAIASTETKETSQVTRRFPTTAERQEAVEEITTVPAPVDEAITMAPTVAVVVEPVTTLKKVDAVATAEEGSAVAEATTANSTTSAGTEMTTTTSNLVSMVAVAVTNPMVITTPISKEDTMMVREKVAPQTTTTTTTSVVVMENSAASPCTEEAAEACAVDAVAISTARTAEGETTPSTADPITVTDKTRTRETPLSQLSKDPALTEEAAEICSCAVQEALGAVNSEEVPLAVAETSEVAEVTSAVEETLEAEEVISVATKETNEVAQTWVVAEATAIKWSTMTKNESAFEAVFQLRLKTEDASMIKSDDALKRKRIGPRRPLSSFLG